MSLSDADLVWNRAAIDEGGSGAREGDRMLASLLLAHGYVMNGGVLHALDLDATELQRAIQAYEYFGLSEVGQLLARAAELAQDEPALDELESELDAAYARLVPGDEFLGSRFKAHYAEHPALYAPRDED